MTEPKIVLRMRPPAEAARYLLDHGLEKLHANAAVGALAVIVEELLTENAGLREALEEARVDRDAARADLAKVKGDRILSVVFGHHKGAPRPFALRMPGRNEREPRQLGAQWPDEFVVIQGSTGGAVPFRAMDAAIRTYTDDGVVPEVVWLSDELDSLAAMEAERDAMRPVVEAAEAVVGGYRLLAAAGLGLRREAKDLIAAVDSYTQSSNPEGDGGADG